MSEAEAGGPPTAPDAGGSLDAARASGSPLAADAIRERLDEGLVLVAAIRAGMVDKMRAVIMTGLVPAIGFVPMALAHGTGAEVQKPLATTVIGGLIAATILTLLVLPAIARVILGPKEGLGEDHGDPAHSPMVVE